MFLFFYWYLAHCQSVTELANNTPKIHEIFRGPRMRLPSASAPQNATSIFGDPASNLLNKKSKIIINQFIEVTNIFFDFFLRILLYLEYFRNMYGVFVRYSWGIHGVFVEYTYVSGMCRVCIGYVSGQYRRERGAKNRDEV